MSIQTEQGVGSNEEQRVSDEEYHAFLTFFGQSVRFVGLEELDGGFSGARIAAISIVPTGESRLSGRYVLKVCRTSNARQEIARHQTVRRNQLMFDLMPRIALSKAENDLQLTGILYTVAGDGLLNSITLQHALDHYSYYPPDRVEEIAARVLAWNLGIADNVRAKKDDGIRAIQRLFNPGDVSEIADEVANFTANPKAPLVVPSLGMGRTCKLNPLPVLLGETTLQLPTDFPIVLGPLHGDLHPGNLLIPSYGREGSIAIIDFAESRRGNALFDIAYLELSLMLNAFSGFESGKDRRVWWVLEDEFLSSQMYPPLNRFPFTVGGNLAYPLRQTLQKRAKRDHLHDIYWASFLAASTEAGLRFVELLKGHPLLQRVAFLSAVSRFDRLVHLYGGVGGTTSDHRSVEPVMVVWPD